MRKPYEYTGEESFSTNADISFKGYTGHGDSEIRRYFCDVNNQVVSEVIDRWDDSVKISIKEGNYEHALMSLQYSMFWRQGLIRRKHL